MKYTRDNPHPDLKYIETKGQCDWFQCQRCYTYQHHPEHFGWQCSQCQFKY